MPTQTQYPVTMPVPRSSAATANREPDPELVGRFHSDVNQFLLNQARSTRSQGQSGGGDPGQPTAFSIARDEHGQTVLSDPYGVAVAVGDSPAQAFAQWVEMAAEHFEDLLENENRLHARMRPQLEFLRRWFRR